MDAPRAPLWGGLCLWGIPSGLGVPNEAGKAAGIRADFIEYLKSHWVRTHAVSSWPANIHIIPGGSGPSAQFHI